jgi:hypothetical protein
MTESYPKTANTTAELKEILAKISFVKSCIDFNWDWEVEELHDRKVIGYAFKGWLINTTFRRPDINTGEIGTGKGRQLYVAKGTSATGIFFTCWILVDLIVKHELMEAIRFDGKRVLNPHHSLEELSLPDLFKEAGRSPAALLLATEAAQRTGNSANFSTPWQGEC